VRAAWPDEPWFQDGLRQVDALRPLERPDRTLGQLALQFVLDHPAVSAAIPGAKTPAQVEANAAASRRPLLTDEERGLIDQVAPV
jgi:aryl-alcohol dehydrogenase-like predicted oxidoreductase